MANPERVIGWTILGSALVGGGMTVFAPAGVFPDWVRFLFGVCAGGLMVSDRSP